MVTRQPLAANAPPKQGNIWSARAEDKRRPVLIVSRDISALQLNRVIVAPTTRTVRSIPTEIPLGADEGLDVDGAASFDNLGPQPVAMLSRRIGRLQDPRSRFCTALNALADY